MGDDEIVDITKKSPEDYVPSNFYNPQRIGKSIAADLIKLAKRFSKVEEQQKNTKLILEKDEIREIVENQYKELVKKQLKEEIEGKKGVINKSIHSAKRFFGFTTAGLVAFVALGLIVHGVYVKNKTTVGKVLEYQGKTDSLTNQVKSYGGRIDSLEKAQEDTASLKKSIDEVAASNKAYTESSEALKKSIDNIAEQQKNYEEQFKAKTDAYDKFIDDFKRGVEPYKKGFEELKSNSEASGKKLNDLEKRINEVDKKYERKTKAYEK